jgi:hypothetical protein
MCLQVTGRKGALAVIALIPNPSPKGRRERLRPLPLGGSWSEGRDRGIAPTAEF